MFRKWFRLLSGEIKHMSDMVNILNVSIGIHALKESKEIAESINSLLIVGSNCWKQDNINCRLDGILWRSILVFLFLTLQQKNRKICL